MQPFPGCTDSIKLFFFHTETTEKYPSFAGSLRLPVHRSCFGIIEAGLWEYNTGWSPVVPATPVAVGDECNSIISVQCESVRPDHASTSPSALASCTTANIIQADSTAISVFERSHTNISDWQCTTCKAKAKQKTKQSCKKNGWRPRPLRSRSSRSTTFAFCVISGSCCATDTSPNSRGDRAFCVVVAKTRNSLPSEVTSSVTLSTSNWNLKLARFLRSFPSVVCALSRKFSPFSVSKRYYIVQYRRNKYVFVPSLPTALLLFCAFAVANLSACNTCSRYFSLHFLM